MDWVQIAAEEDAVTSAKDRVGFIPENASSSRLMKDTEESGASRKSDTSFGLCINVHAFSELRLSSPPPCLSVEQGKVDSEIRTGHPTQVSSCHSQLNGAGPASTSYSIGSNEKTSFRPLESTHSAQAAGSSATLLAPCTEKVALDDSKASLSPEQRRLKKRHHIIEELVDTEYSFGRDMKVVNGIYKATSSSCLGLSVEDAITLFANSDQVVHFSMTFLYSLKKAARMLYAMPKSQRCRRTGNRNFGSATDEDQSTMDESVPGLEKDRSTSIGMVFLAHMTQIEEVYSEYVKNYAAANKKLRILQRNPKVAIWLDECRELASDLTNAWDLDSLLVKPVQRILKYPLFLTQLLELTPIDHPDRIGLLCALQGATNISVRINEIKRRTDLVGKVHDWKYKKFDVRAGLSRAFGRRTENPRQQVGVSNIFKDKDYEALARRFGYERLQLQLVLRDVEEYIKEAENSMARFNELITAMEGIAEVVQFNYSELESKWRLFKRSVWGITTKALPEHLDVIRKSVLAPMTTLIQTYEEPQRTMRKRDKWLLDYARFKVVEAQAGKTDKKIAEEGEQFVALNESLKNELARLKGLTAKLAEACLKNLVQFQTTWYSMLQTKNRAHAELFSDDFQEVISNWSSGYASSEAQMLSLGICNGALLADIVHLANLEISSTWVNRDSPRPPSLEYNSNPRSFPTAEEPPKFFHDFSFGSSVFQMDSKSSNSRNLACPTSSGRTVLNTLKIPRSPLLLELANTSA
ncbi:hypothetical protein N7489_004626 [Penicillium chrysogenum]|uniref:uncharacterized protein n=1 Tax=Penicillium chrysogenum TaxID=5076 RepID=UPI0024DF207D|nr:uncharacterized protein N7489_004626 [Penicillium chrysogenum]KAJ5244530.1 hypothetical protein N7489_004626 [Penicillium chrysogenum]KAJ5852991.1 hypothetical protein N7534_005534 [Penicillium rubens]